MLIAPSSEPPRRVTALRGGRVWFAMMLLMMMLSGSCFFELPPLADSSIGGGAGGGNTGGALPFGGSSGTLGGSSVGGSAGGGGLNCLPDEKLCGETCRPTTELYGCASNSCEPCRSPPHTTVACREGQCAVLDCEPGFADCNGDTINSVGTASGDGCEYSLGVPAPTVATLSVPFANIQVDGERDDWSALPAYAFEEVCANCRDDQTELISADSSVPPRADLDARFRVAWDFNKFYLLVEAFDNQLYQPGVLGGRCQQQTVASCEDAVQVFFLGKEDRTHGYFNDNQRVFLGLSERFSAPGQAAPAAVDVEIKTGREGSLCYRIEAQVDWAYITNTRNNPGSAPGHFPPAASQSYGFNIAVNDWDAPISDPNGIQRQSQVFWSEPGAEIATTPDGIGTMTLVNGPDAGQ